MERVCAASAELRSVLKSCVNADGARDAGVAEDAAPRSSVEEVCARLQEAVSSIQHYSSLGVSAQSALTRDVQPTHSQQSADAITSIPCSSELRLTLPAQIEALLQLPQSVLDKLPS